MFDANPNEPTRTMRRGLEISVRRLRGKHTIRYERKLELTRGSEEAADSLQRYRETKCEEEDTIHQGCKNLGTVPTVGVTSVGVCLVCELRKCH